MIESWEWEEVASEPDWSNAPSLISTPPEPVWTGVLQAVLMDRDDAIDVHWTDAGSRRVSAVESELNSGLRLWVARQTRAQARQTGQIAEFSLLRIEGQGETEFRPGEVYSNHGDFLTARLGIGLTEALLSGRSHSTLGVRYSRVADQIDYQSHPEIAATENHIVTFDFATTGWWQWRGFVFSAGLSGGVGANRIEQHGLRLGGAFAPFSQQSAAWATVSEAAADLLWPITPQTFLQIGARGIAATGVAQARDTWGAPHDPDAVRLIGMTFGVWRDF